MKLMTIKGIIKSKLDYFIPEIIKNSCYWFIYKTKYHDCQIKSGVKLSRKIELGKRCQIGKYVSISGEVSVGEYTFINDYTVIDASVTRIGKFCSISHNVKIGMRKHPTHLFSTSPYLYSSSKQLIKKSRFVEFGDETDTFVGNDVYLASSVIILAGVSIGDGAIVAAGAVVTKNVPAYSIVAGVPAKIVGYRFNEEVRRALLNQSIFDKSIQDIIEYSEKFNDSINS